MVTGQSIWYANWLMEEEPNTAKIWGKAEIIVEGGGGRWELSWYGWRTPTGEAPFIEWVSPFKLVVDAVGTGKEGAVKGLVAKWTYTMDFDGDFSSLFYNSEGYIVK